MILLYLFHFTALTLPTGGASICLCPLEYSALHPSKRKFRYRA